MTTSNSVPSAKELLNPTLRALREAGHSASIKEIAERVIQDLDLSEEATGQLWKGGPLTTVEYRLMWARTALKLGGLVANSARGVWVLTPQGIKTNEIDPDGLYRTIRRGSAPADPSVQPPPESDEELDEIEGDIKWQEQLSTALRDMQHDAFERLCKRMLRESGFVEVEVLGRPRDGGIDGRGILQMASLVTLPVYFQCKRYKGKVGSPEVRDFRGAMDGRGERGLLITTSSFTEEAKKEAVRDGARRIDLVDGASLIVKLKELSLGVETKPTEQVAVDVEFFNSI